MEKKAEYQISSYLNKEIPEFIIQGNVTCSTLNKMLNEVDTIFKTTRAKKAIFDIRSLNRHIELTEIYRFVRNQHFLIYESESAITDLPENAPFATAVINAGLHWTWFTDIDAARTWLKSKRC